MLDQQQQNIGLEFIDSEYFPVIQNLIPGKDLKRCY